jgi:BirA family biotin operon repressor/biotin-[acetyl-CoA-carboxylase] ligase
MRYIFEHFLSIASTNDYAKSKRADGQSRIITADFQSGGRGTKGRSFSSNEGGVYLTKLDFYTDFPAKNAFKIMANTAVAVCETLRSFGVAPVIKWPNDIHVNGKKICGILIENTFSGANISSSIVGVGLNICNALPKDLEEIATTLMLALGEKISVQVARERLIENLCKDYSFEKYLAFVGYMGEKADLIFADKTVTATLLSVDGEGGLWVDIDGEKRRVASGEVSLRTRGAV